MVLFPKALFLVTNFPKIIIKYNFSIEFSSKIFKISQNFPTIWVFCPNGEKWTHGFVKSFQKYAKIKHFHKFLKKFFEIFWNFSQNSPTVCVSRPNAPKINARFFKFHWKISKNNVFYQCFEECFRRVSKIFWASSRKWQIC